jgi:hypothetical protein
MNVGKTLIAQVMEFVPWKTIGRIIERHKGGNRNGAHAPFRLSKRLYPDQLPLSFLLF